MAKPDSWLVPGHQMWRAKRARRGRRRVVVKARHRLLPWQTITVETSDLRYGAEAIARYLSGGHVGRGLIDSRGTARQASVFSTE